MKGIWDVPSSSLMTSLWQIPFQRYWQIPPSEYDVVKTHINQLLEKNIIRDSCSPYAFPTVLAKKKDGTLRMCVENRQMNAKTWKDVFPLPQIEEILDSLTGARWTSLVGTTRFLSQRGINTRPPLYTFLTFWMEPYAFGLCNAPGTFQRLVERLFGDQ